MRLQDLYGLLDEINSLLTIFAFVGREKRSEAILQSDALRRAVFLAADIPALEGRATAIAELPIFSSMTDGVAYAIADLEPLKASLSPFLKDVRHLLQLLAPYKPTLQRQHNLQIQAPDGIKTLGELRAFTESLESFIVYPATGTGMEPPVLDGVDSGSIWLIVSYLTDSPFLLTVGCLDIFSVLIQHVMRHAFVCRQMQQYSNIADLGEETVRDALRNIKDRFGRPGLEELIERYAQDLPPEQRNEWITRMLEVGFKQFELQMDAGMKILVHAGSVRESLSRSLPREFSLQALKKAGPQGIQHSLSASPDDNAKS